jgi:hypothetical protein
MEFSVIALALFFGLLLGQTVQGATFVCNDDFDCTPHGACGPLLNCVCDSGFWGAQCDEACPLQCQNGGQCVLEDEHGGLVEGSGYYCECPPGFVGGLCRQSVDSDDQGGSQPVKNADRGSNVGGGTGAVVGGAILAGLAVLLVVLVAVRRGVRRRGRAKTTKSKTSRTDDKLVMEKRDEETANECSPTPDTNDAEIPKIV